MTSKELTANTAIQGTGVDGLDHSATKSDLTTRLNDAAEQGLYNPAREHDACGVGFVAHMKGEKSHRVVSDGLQVLE
ncbi:MAG: hypothetical protein HWE23_02750, partial [Rhodobacteraceae bacterium]|nr:hypothetical protein [Paracoccaceae bacterium]